VWYVLEALGNDFIEIDVKDLWADCWSTFFVGSELRRHVRDEQHCLEPESMGNAEDKRWQHGNQRGT
jgi:hypothetical protein